MTTNRQNQHYIRYADPNIFYHEELAHLKILVQIPNRAADARARIHTIMMNPTMPIIYRAHCHLALAIEEGPYRVDHASSAKKLIEYMLGYGPHCAEYHEMMNSANQMLAIAPVQPQQESNKNHDINNIKKPSADVVIIDEAHFEAVAARKLDQQIKQPIPCLLQAITPTEPQKSNLKRTSTDLVDDDETDDDANQSVVTKKPKPAVEPTKKKLTVTFKLPVHPDKPAKPVNTTITKSITTTVESVKPVKSTKAAKPVKPLRVGDRKSARLSMLAVDRRAVKYDKPAPTPGDDITATNNTEQDANNEDKVDDVHNTDTVSRTSSGEWEIVNVKTGADGNEMVVDDEDDGDTTEDENEMSFEDLVNLRLAEEEEERLLAAQFGGTKERATKLDSVE